MTRLLSLLAIVGCVLGTSTPIAAQNGLDDPRQKPIGKWADARLTVDRPKAKWGETVLVTLTITPKDGGYTYPTRPIPDQDSKNSIELPKPALDGLIFIGGVIDPAGVKDEKPDGTKEKHYPEPVTWTFRAVVSPRAKPGTLPIVFGKSTALLACKGSCVTIRGDKLPTDSIEIVDGLPDPEKVHQADLSAAIELLLGKPIQIPAPADRSGGISAADLAALKAELAGLLQPAPPPKAASTGEGNRKAAKSTDQYRTELNTIADQLQSNESGSGVSSGKDKGLWAFLATAAAWGFISLITPCVFPMIPITVSIFLKQAHGSMRERLKLAAVYSGTIIIVLGISAFALLKFMAWLAADPFTNILLGLLFLVLALSLFGMYELTLPNFLLRRLQSKQQKGGVTGMIFGALAFTVISFTCVAPFLGGFAGISAANAGTGDLISVPTSREILGGLVFATAFAAPFFVLALVPGLLKALPRSGGWLDSVKVVMGFLEIAAALKFFRTAEIRLLTPPAYFTYDMVLAGWVAIAIACGLYLLNVYRLPHDEEKPNIGVTRLLFASLFLGFGLYLLPALFKGHDGKPQRPAGAVYAWVEAFLLPDPESWGTDLNDAIVRARNSSRPVFIDFTGKTCTNCRYNEQNVFTKPNIRELLEKFERVQLYTDEVPAEAYGADPGKPEREREAEVNREFQVKVFKDSALPLYAVLLPTGNDSVTVIGVYDEGKINSPERFAKFLEDALEKARKK